MSTAVDRALLDTSVVIDYPQGSVAAHTMSAAISTITLAELALARTHGVQIAGVDHRGMRVLNPGADERLLAGDEVLVLGTPAQIQAFRIWLQDADHVGK